MKEKSLNWLQRQLKNKKIALTSAEARNDTVAVVNLQKKIDIIDYLIKSVLREE